MKYRTRELRILNQLNDDTDISEYFRVPPDLRIMSILIFVVLGVTLIIAILMEVDQIIPAQGVLETQQKLFVLRSADAGFIKKIHINEGDIVLKGDILIEIDPELLELKIARLKKQQNATARAIWTSFYEIEGQISVKLKTSLEESLRNIIDPIGQIGYQDFFRKKLSNEIAVVEKSLAELTENRKRDSKQLVLAEQNVDLLEEILIRQRKLYQQKLGTKIDFEKNKQQILNGKGRVNSLISNLEAYGLKRDRLLAEQNKMENSFISNHLIKIFNSVDQYSSNLFEQKGLKRSLEELTLRAPFDAIIDSLNVLGKHEVIKSGASLISLRATYKPENLIINMLIPSNFAIWVQEGMNFRASSQGNSPEDHGYIIGKIGYISKSTEEKNGARFYRVKGMIEKFDFTDRLSNSSAKQTLIRPGQQLSVEINVGRRRLIYYIIDPFADGFKRAFREPS